MAAALFTSSCWPCLATSFSGTALSETKADWILASIKSARLGGSLVQTSADVVSAQSKISSLAVKKTASIEIVRQPLMSG